MITFCNWKGKLLVLLKLLDRVFSLNIFVKIPFFTDTQSSNHSAPKCNKLLQDKIMYLISHMSIVKVRVVRQETETISDEF